jgi:hypothetical protein
MRKTAADIRKEAARMAREYAEERDDTGDPEGAEEFRDLARAIERIKINKPR